MGRSMDPKQSHTEKNKTTTTKLNTEQSKNNEVPKKMKICLNIIINEKTWKGV